MSQPKNLKTIVCIAPDSWESLYRTQQQIMGRLAKDYRVIFYEPGRKLGDNQIKSAVNATKNFFSVNVTKPMENLEVVPGVPSLPLFRTQLPKSVLQISTPVTSRINYLYSVRHLKRTLKVLNVKDPILWLWGFGDFGISAPRLIDDIDNIGSCYLVYDEGPDFAHNVRIKEILRNADNIATQKSSFVITTSQSQLDRRIDLNSEILFMPNGVDFPHFNSPLVKDVALPADIANLPKPIIGFSGWMGYQMDVPLLIKIAERFSSGSLVLCGPNTIPASDELTQLMGMPNVHFLGSKKPQDLPAYFQAFDVATIPYVLEGHTRFIYPLKLHEYLAAGRAVVSTDLPNLYPHEDIVRIARSHDEYLTHLQNAIEDYSPEAVKIRTDLASQYSWDDRAKEVKDFVDSLE